MKALNDRNEVIRQMVAEGATYAVIATKFGISRERVRQIGERMGATSRRRWVRKDAAALRIRMFREREDKTASKTGLSLHRLRQLLHYDRYTGVFTWRVNRGGSIKAGEAAGSLHTFGHVQIRVDYKLYMAHVLAWFYSFEQWPKNMIDHENRIPDDNRLSNLRQATCVQNLGNRTATKFNTSGFKGVYRQGNRWRAEIAHVKLGYFDTPEQASAAYNEAAKIRYGAFACSALDTMPRS